MGYHLRNGLQEGIHITSVQFSTRLAPSDRSERGVHCVENSTRVMFIPPRNFFQGGYMR